MRALEPPVLEPERDAQRPEYAPDQPGRVGEEGLEALAEAGEDVRGRPDVGLVGVVRVAAVEGFLEVAVRGGRGGRSSGVRGGG